MKHLPLFFLTSSFLQANQDPQWQIDRFVVIPGQTPGAERDLRCGFSGLPWTRYEVELSSDLNNWTPLGQAAESGAGKFSFGHSGDLDLRFFRATPFLPGPEKTHEAYFAASSASLSSAIHRFTIGYAFETLIGVENLALEKSRMLEELSDALTGEIIVLEEPPNQWRIAWGGDEIFTNDPLQRDQAILQFQQAEQQAVTELETLELELPLLQEYPPFLLQAQELLVTEMEAAQLDQVGIECLTLPVGPQYIQWQAPLAFINLQALQEQIDALNLEKTALQDAIDRNRAEAERKRRLADSPIQLFGINGTWYVRWGAIERTFPTRAEAENFRDGVINLLINNRRQEADDLDAKADEQEAQLTQLCAERDALAAGLPAAESEAEDKENALGGSSAETPDDEEDPRMKFKTWVDFDALYLDWMWLEMLAEWQKRKDDLRNTLTRMGASPEEIAKALKHFDDEQTCRRKWMNNFCGDPIELKLLFVNQFSPFTIDVENAKWEVQYRNFSTFESVFEKLGTGQELNLTPEKAKEIFQRAREIEGFTGSSVVLDFHVTFDKVYDDGSREICEQMVQIIFDSKTRAEAEAQRDAIRNATPGGIR
jgi:hypothetical protein